MEVNLYNKYESKFKRSVAWNLRKNQINQKNLKNQINQMNQKMKIKME